VGRYVPESVLGQVLMPRPGSMPWKLSVPLAPVSASVRVLFPTCSLPEPQIPEKKSSPEPVGGTSTMAMLFRPDSSLVGGSQPHEIMQPYLTLNFCIALTGIYPTQN